MRAASKLASAEGQLAVVAADEAGPLGVASPPLRLRELGLRAVEAGHAVALARQHDRVPAEPARAVEDLRTGSTPARAAAPSASARVRSSSTNGT